MTVTPYKQLEQEWQRLHAFNGALSLLRWDAAVMMPRGSADVRGEQLAAIEIEHHALLTSPKISRLIDRAQAGSASLDEWQLANLRAMRRQRDHAIATPVSLISRLARATSIAEVRWSEARLRKNFALFAPHLEEVLQLVRDKASLLGQALGLSPYDALIDGFTPGLRTAEIDAIFKALSRRLPTLIRSAIEQQSANPPLPRTGRFAHGKQKQLICEVMKVLGFPFDRGRLDESDHPFTEGVPGDIRVTTRLDYTDVFTGLLAAVHETGHALYDLGVPTLWRDQPVGRDRGIALEESQSLLFEMIICRNRAFLTWLKPLLEKHFAVSGPEWEVDNLCARLTQVRRSMIRVDADELTYPLHVMLRYGIEKDLLDGRLAVKDLPEAWNQGMQDRLEVRPANDAEGCLQDVHWAHGSFGYFPSYVIGGVIAAQLAESLRAATPDLDAQIARGGFRRPEPVARHARPRPRGRGCRCRDLMKAATGKPLSANAALRLPRDQVRRRGAAMNAVPQALQPLGDQAASSRPTCADSWGKAIEDYAMISEGDRRDGLPVRRQGFLHAARHAAVPAAQCAGRLLADRRQSRPEAAGVSARSAARLPARARSSIFHVIRAGHLQRREAGSSPKVARTCGLCSRLHVAARSNR